DCRNDWPVEERFARSSHDRGTADYGARCHADGLHSPVDPPHGDAGRDGAGDTGGDLDGDGAGRCDHGSGVRAPPAHGAGQVRFRGRGAGRGGDRPRRARPGRQPPGHEGRADGLPRAVRGPARGLGPVSRLGRAERAPLGGGHLGVLPGGPGSRAGPGQLAHRAQPPPARLSGPPHRRWYSNGTSGPEADGRSHRCRQLERGEHPMRTVPVLLFAAALAACDPQTPPGPQAGAEVAPAEPAGTPDAAPAAAGDASARLARVLAEKPEEFRARYAHRHPQETLEFLGIEPGMTVVEVLPGGGWYSQVLIPYLGREGRLIGANYAQDMWPRFGMFDQAFIDSMQTWTTDWPREAQQWQGEDGATVDAFELGSMPASLEGQADAVLFIRALHNLARFEGEGGYLTAALGDAHRVLKPGGILGVVQHEA